MPHNVEADDTGVTWSGTFEAPMTVSYNGKLEYAAFCVTDGSSCFVEPSSEIVTGQYTDAKEIIPFTVGDLTAGETYSCYIATLLPKSMVCSDPVAFTAVVNGGRVQNAGGVQSAAAEAVPELPVDTEPVSFVDENVPAPAPAVDVPAPVVEDAPAPVVDDVPAPVVEDVPAPVVEDVPAPVVEDAPAPVVEDAPAPTVDAPAPAVDAPAPEAIVETVNVRETPVDVPEEGSVTQGVATFTPLE